MTNQNNSTPDGKRLEKITANYLNMVKNMQLGEEKLKKYRNELKYDYAYQRYYSRY